MASFFFVILSFCFSAYQIKTYFDNKELQENGQIFNVKVITKQCLYTGSRAQYVNVEYFGKQYKRLEIPSKKYCLSVEDSIPLFYDGKHDKFYLPNSLFMNKRYVIASILLFIISLLPWKIFTHLMIKYKLKT